MVFHVSGAPMPGFSSLDAAGRTLLRVSESMGLASPPIVPNSNRDTDRAQRRAQDIRFQLGGEDFISIDGLQPPRPKGMHQRTYGAQIEQMEAYEMRTNSHVLALIERLKRR